MSARTGGPARNEDRDEDIEAVLDETRLASGLQAIQVALALGVVLFAAVVLGLQGARGAPAGGAEGGQVPLLSAIHAAVALSSYVMAFAVHGVLLDPRRLARGGGGALAPGEAAGGLASGGGGGGAPAPGEAVESGGGGLPPGDGRARAPAEAPRGGGGRRSSASHEIRSALRRLAAALQAATIVRLAALEAPALFGLVVCLLGVLDGTLRAEPLYWLNLLSSVVFLLFAALSFPARDRLAEALKGRVEEMRDLSPPLEDSP